MKEVNLVNLKDAANRLLFDMSDKEYKTLLEEFKVIKKQMELIASDSSIDKYTPMVFPFDVTISTLRDDEPIKPTDREDILRNAKNKIAGQIKIKKVGI